jgi:hypothetical protein
MKTALLSTDGGLEFAELLFLWMRHLSITANHLGFNAVPE